MWLFTTKGFFSIVQYRDEPEFLLVRARVKGDIEQYWPWADIQETKDADYLYRAKIPKSAVEAAVCDIVQSIDYPSYKGAVEDKGRYWSWYAEVDAIMANMQESYHENRETEDLSGG